MIKSLLTLYSTLKNISTMNRYGARLGGQKKSLDTKDDAHFDDYDRGLESLPGYKRPYNH